MVRKCKFTIGKSNSSRLTLEQRILGYNRQLTKLNTKVDLISAWISKKFGVLFLVEAPARVKLVDLSKHLALVKSTAPKSVNPGVKKAKQKLQTASPFGGQNSGSDDLAEGGVMVDSDSEVNEAEMDDETITVGDPVDGRIPLEDGSPEREGRISRKRQEVKGTKPRRTLGNQKFKAQGKGPQKHSCNWPNCKYFGNKSNLVVHQRTHTGVKPFKCTWPKCGKSFNVCSNRTVHRRTHTGGKPYVCNWPDCDKSFGISDGLQKHRRTHTGERPFKCGFCDYQCTQSSTLTSHMRSHTGEKPYKCRVCAATFAESGNKVRHEKLHHRSH